MTLLRCEKTNNRLGKISVHHKANKRLVSRKYKELSKLDRTRGKNKIERNYPNREQVKDGNRNFTEDGFQTVNKPWKKMFSIISHKGNVH